MQHTTVGADRRRVNRCAALARPRRLPTAARTRLVTDQQPAGAEPVTFGQYPDGRTIHAPLVQRTRSPTASMLPG